METKNDSFLRLGRIRLTPDLIEEINMVQTGGTATNGIPTDDMFDNQEIDNEISRLNKLIEFFIGLHQDGEDMDPAVTMIYLCHLQNLKDHFKKFRVD